MSINRIGRIISIFAIILCLAGCIDAERFGGRYAVDRTEEYNPKFQYCAQKVDEAFAAMNYARAHKLYQVSYSQWTDLNELLGEALSAQLNRDYKECNEDAQDIVTYVRTKIAFTEWRRDLNSPFSIKAIPSNPHNRYALQKVKKAARGLALLEGLFELSPTVLITKEYRIASLRRYVLAPAPDKPTTKGKQMTPKFRFALSHFAYTPIPKIKQIIPFKKLVLSHLPITPKAKEKNAALPKQLAPLHLLHIPKNTAKRVMAAKTLTLSHFAHGPVVNKKKMASTKKLVLSHF